jgi:hypothetical protein
VPLTAEQRSLRARLAAYSMHARHEARETTAAAREARWRRYLEAVDPEGTLPPAERQRRAEALRRADMARLAYLSARSRQKKRQRRNQ